MILRVAKPTRIGGEVQFTVAEWRSIVLALRTIAGGQHLIPTIEAALLENGVLQGSARIPMLHGDIETVRRAMNHLSLIGSKV